MHCSHSCGGSIRTKLHSLGVYLINFQLKQKSTIDVVRRFDSCCWNTFELYIGWITVKKKKKSHMTAGLERSLHFHWTAFSSNLSIMWTMFWRPVFNHHLHNMQAFHVPVSQLASALLFSPACLHAPWHVDKLGSRHCCGWPGRPGQRGLVHKVSDRQQSAVNENAPSEPLGSTSASSWDWKTEMVEVDMEIQPLAIQTTTIVLKRTVHVRHGWATLVPGKSIGIEWFC